MRGCVFDLDGTLVNTLPTVHHYCNLSLAHFGFCSIAEDECRKLCRLPIASFYHRLLQLGGCPEERIEELAPEIRDYDLAIYLKDFQYLTRPYPAIPGLLRELRERRAVLAVLTNKPAPVAESLMESLFPGMFDIVRGQTPETISKPDPRSLWNLLDDLGLAREECVYVGDTDVDMETAQNTGMDCMLVSWGFREAEALMRLAPRYLVSDPAEMPALILQPVEDMD